jgi:putative ABC transport system permease protein
MHFLTFVLKNVARRPLRSCLTVTAIAIAIACVISLVGIANRFEHSFLDIYDKLGVDLIVVRAGAQQRLTSALDEKLEDKIRAVPGVQEVLPGLLDMLSFEKYGMRGVVVQGWKPETYNFELLNIVRGRNLKRSDGKAAVLGSILARNLGKKPGDTVELVEDETFTVVGIYESFNVYENGGLVIPLAELQRIMDRRGQVTGFSVILTEPHNERLMAEVRGRIETLAPHLSVMSARDHVNTVTEIQMAKAMARLTSAIALIIGLFGLMNTMVMAVHERTREIGILRAVGWRAGRVIRLILLEAVVLSLTGAVVGTVAAVALVFALTRVPMVNGLIEGRVSPVMVLYGFLLAIAVGLLGGIFPARRAARMLPTAALRHE